MKSLKRVEIELATVNDIELILVEVENWQIRVRWVINRSIFDNYIRM